MKPITAERVETAEGDLVTAIRELLARRRPNHDAACFHARQCAEKYLKACLQERGIRFEKPDTPGRLLELLLPVILEWVDLRPRLRELNARAVPFRCPGESADREVARRAAHLRREVRRPARRHRSVSSQATPRAEGRHRAGPRFLHSSLLPNPAIPPVAKGE
jgi:HEPN domain-containing protein